MSRAEELRAAGATVLADKSGGDSLGSTPFIKWPVTAPPTAWVEGTLTEIWEGKYGHNATIIVTNSGGLGDEHRVGAKANVGLSSATLKDRVTEGHIGEVLHFEFLGWVESANGGNRYRQFEIQVVPLELRPFVVEETIEVPEVVEVSAPQSTEDELPF